MAAGRNPMDTMLWRIAELGSRYSDPRWADERAQTWSALEEAVTRAGADVSAMVVAMEVAQDRMRNAEARELAAQRERNRHRSRASALSASLREARAEAQAAEKALASTELERDELRATVTALRDERNEVRAALALARSERDLTQAALVLARGQRDEAQTALAGPAGQVAEPQEPVAADPPEAGDGTPAPRATVPSWWKATPPPVVAERIPPAEEPAEEQEPESDGILLMATDSEATPETAEETGPEIDLTDRVCHLSVRATIGRLLPDDFGELLVEGASVVRREGRLAVVIAVRRAAPGWSDPDPSEVGEEQARILRDEGYRVELTGQAIAS